MPELVLIREWFAYNAGARRGYLEAFSKLPPGELARDRGASHPSLLDILEHTLGAYYFWFSSLSKGDGDLPRFGPVRDEIENPPLDEIAEKENPSLEEVARFERAFQAQVDLFLGGLVEGDLQRTIPIPKAVASSYGSPTVTVRDALWHLVEEELQHRGELNALLWQMDVEAPILSWIGWAELHGSQEA
ncbi:MAG: DinB family protein [Nitrososphaerales archaeon]